MKIARFLRTIGVMKVLQNGKMKMRLIHPVTWVLILIGFTLGLYDILTGRMYLRTVWLEIKNAVVLV